MFATVIFLCLANAAIHRVGGLDIKATCDLFRYETSKLIGQVNFVQKDSSTEVKVSGCINGLLGKYSFYVHQYGGIGHRCADAGSHFNPENEIPGNITDTERYTGYLGKIHVTADNGHCWDDLSDRVVSLLPGRRSIIGRVLAVTCSHPHAFETEIVAIHFDDDDQTEGDREARVACCVIGLTSEPPSSVGHLNLHFATFAAPFIYHLIR